MCFIIKEISDKRAQEEEEIKEIKREMAQRGPELHPIMQARLKHVVAIEVTRNGFDQSKYYIRSKRFSSRHLKQIGDLNEEVKFTSSHVRAKFKAILRRGRDRYAS